LRTFFAQKLLYVNMGKLKNVTDKTIFIIFFTIIELTSFIGSRVSPPLISLFYLPIITCQLKSCKKIMNFFIFWFFWVYWG